jgi:hypothetical protein
VPKATESGGDSAPIICLTGFEPAETLHQIKGRAVDLNRINRRPAMQSLAPTSGVSGAPLPKGGSFLNHVHSGRRQCRSSGNDVSLPLKSYAQPLFIEHKLITSHTILIHSGPGSTIRARR